MGKKHIPKLLATAKVELKMKPIVVNTYIKKDLKSITQTSTIRNYRDETKLKPSEKNIKIKADVNERKNRRIIKIKETTSFLWKNKQNWKSLDWPRKKKGEESNY